MKRPRRISLAQFTATLIVGVAIGIDLTIFVQTQAHQVHPSAQAGHVRDWEVYFSPQPKNGDPLLSPEMAIVRLIDMERGPGAFVHAQWYTNTSEKIRDALIRANDVGVEVRVTFDPLGSRVNGTIAPALEEAHVWVGRDPDHLRYICHAKSVITSHGVATGSYNPGDRATYGNVEELWVDHDLARIAVRDANWHVHAQRCQPPIPLTRQQGLP